MLHLMQHRSVLDRASAMRRSVDLVFPPAAEQEAVHEGCSENENERHHFAEAGVAVDLVVAWPADAAKRVLYRPLGHCHRTMSHFVLIALIRVRSDYAGHYQISFDNLDRPLACHRRRPLRPTVPEEGEG